MIPMPRRTILIALLMSGCGFSYPSPAKPVSVDRLVELHNEARGRSVWGLKPLNKNQKLMKYSQDWASHMAKTGRMRHSRIGDIMSLGFSLAGENIAWGQPSEKDVMSAWLMSPGHRANIMGRRYESIGCGAAMDSRGRIYWCVCFGRE